VLIDPIFFACSSISSTIARLSDLKGIVIFKPLRLFLFIILIISFTFFISKF
jgi:hypothetical protein